MSKLWSMTKGARYVDGVLVEEYDHGTKSSMGPTMISIEDHQEIVAELHIETHEKDGRIAVLEAQSIAKDERIKELEVGLHAIREVTCEMVEDLLPYPEPP